MLEIAAFANMLQRRHLVGIDPSQGAAGGGNAAVVPDGRAVIASIVEDVRELALTLRC